MAYNVYKDNELIAEGIIGKEYIAEGLTPNTEYSFSVSEIIGDEESEKETIKVTTLPIKVTGVTLAPKTSTADTGKADGANLTATIAPDNASNKAVGYSISPQTEGLTVNDDGRITWTDAVPPGTYTTTVETADGNKTDTHVLTLKNPVIAVTSVELAPKNMTGVSGTAANRQLTPTVAPANATNKAVTYSVAPETAGLTVSASGVLAWTDAVEAGEYTVTVTTTDGNKTATSTLALSDPEPEPEE